MRIAAGPLRGLLWQRHHRYVNGYWLGTYEPALQDALVRLARPGGRALDLGANAGFFSLLLASCVGPKGAVVAVDPDPANCASIAEQARLNGFAHVGIIQGAVAGVSGWGHLDGRSPGSPVARVLITPQEEPGTVALYTVDDLARLHGRPDVIKVDVEGAEGVVLAGATEVLRAHRPVWIVETHGTPLGLQVWDRFAAAGYTVQGLDGRTRRREEVAAADHLVALPSRRPLRA